MHIGPCLGRENRACISGCRCSWLAYPAQKQIPKFSIREEDHGSEANPIYWALVCTWHGWGFESVFVLWELECGSINHKIWLKAWKENDASSQK
jgi:hypothetical protein